jgi:hypothetical protein
VLTIGPEKLGIVKMRKLRILICQQCNNQYETRLKTICCSRDCSNKLQGNLRKTQINPETGLSKSKEIALKSSITMKENSWYGSENHLKCLKHTPDVLEKRGKSISKAHLKIDENTGLTKAALATKKAMKTKVDKGIYIDPIYKDAYELYRDKVRLLTEKQDLSKLDGYKERARAGVINGKHLDHIFSIKAGYTLNVDPVIMSSLCNLRFISYQQNVSKKDKCDIELNELLKLYKDLTESKTI